jgi:hypothetical protein
MGEMDELERTIRLIDAAENIAREMEALRVLKEHELGVELQYGEYGGGPYVPTGEPNEE